ncbi:MAG TPA: acyl-CoA thioester hydrolase/BAAT C-terminal domain-containing protein [Actinoplanes sp.]|nr:acyl-CoA thioester hydrolase/BAAT C-terminal domain-containing protein [Actinoplanes sp.]
MTGPVVAEKIVEPGLVGILCTPGTPGPHPAVLVVGGSEGSVPGFAAAALAREGFAALAVAYFGVGPLPRDLVEIPIEYFAGALERLARHPAVRPGRLAVLGRSRGGELALLLAAAVPERVAGVVAYVPSSVAWQAAPSDPGLAAGGPRSSWSFRGQPVPYVPMASPTPADGDLFAAFVSGRPTAFRPLFERAMRQGDAVGAAAVAVERIAGPVLVLSGGADLLWPSELFGRLITGRLERHRHPYRYQHVHVPEAGHLLGVPGTASRPRRPGFDRLLLGGTVEIDERTSREHWPAVVEFLRHSCHFDTV